MPEVMERTEIVCLDPEQVGSLNDEQLLAAIWALESVYNAPTVEHDHRKYLSRDELEHAFLLLQQLAQERIRVTSP